MASVFQENIGVQHEKITVKLSKEDYLPGIDKALKQYSKNAAIPGFRKGMVPVSMIRKMYGQSVFSDEVLRIAGKQLEDHLIQNKAEIFARPIPAASQEQLSFDLNNPQDFTFEFEIGTKPEFSIPLLSGKETLPYYKIKVTDEMVREEAERLQYKAGEMTEPETVSSGDDVLNVEFDELNENGELKAGGIHKDNSLLVRYFNDSLQQQLMGKKKGDTVDFILNQTFDEKLLPAIMRDLGLDPAKEEDKAMRFRLLITKLGHVEKSELNKEMYDKIYPGRGLETEEDFLSVLREEMERYWDSQSKNQLHNEIFERLVHETPIEIPTQFLKRWMSVGGEKYKSPEEVDKEFGGFEHQLRWQLISDRVIEENKLGIEREELETAARMEIMNYFGQMSISSGDMDWLDGVVEKQLKDEKFRGELENKVMTQKLFWLLEQKFNLQETPVSLEEFSKIPASHHHHH
ncbi:MAG TPA: trigger factor [Chitinophagaceae bacterium]|nr:trigger factor [Chitinophagaceae bacterium]